jgi:hypothetical protein
MHAIRDFIKNTDLKTKLHDEHEPIKDEEFFRAQCLRGFDRLVALKDKYRNKPALVAGLGPSLLEIEKEKYDSFLKIVCNDFDLVPGFFDDNFKPDFWCGANSLWALERVFSVCMERDIDCFITIPKKTEFEELLSRFEKQEDKILPWIWEHRVFQHMLASKYNLRSIYSHCNTITNHMIGFALWLGCNPIHVTGFDLSYVAAVEETGRTHAGFTIDYVENDTHGDLNRFDDHQEKTQIMNDLRHMCAIAYKNGIEIHNLSFEKNKLPYNLSYEIKK